VKALREIAAELLCFAGLLAWLALLSVAFALFFRAVGFDPSGGAL
jgi:hypothetical protein